eukprot:gene9674-biopygen10059
MENERLSSYNTMPLNDETLLKEYNISTLDDFAAQYPQYAFNELQFMLHANSERFISVQGGNSVIASYFGGTNIVYCREGQELTGHEYERLYPRFSGARIIHVSDSTSLRSAVTDAFLSADTDTKT